MAAVAAIRLRFGRAAILRMLAAGAAWGVALSVGFAAMAAWSCDAVCLDGIAVMTAVNIAAGIVTIGPLAAFAPRKNE